MNTLKFILFNIIATLLRLFPLPCRTGIITIGNPDRRSPVFLTGNYIITVLRVKRAIEGNAYLLVANSRGINVWCAGGGGHFTNHDIISILPDGRRVYEFHPWEKKLELVDTYIYTDVSIYAYLKKLKDFGERRSNYKTIWYYY